MPTKPEKINSKWAIRALWYSPDGKKQSKYKSGFDLKRDAETWAQEYENKQRNLISGSHRLLLREYLDEWIARKERGKELAPNTLRGYRVNIKKINETIGDFPLQRVRKSHVQDMINGINGKRKTKEYVRATLRTALEDAVDDELIDRNPARKITFPDDDEPFTAKILSKDQILQHIKILREQGHPLYLPVLLAVSIGCRRGEALGAQWADIDWTAGTITIKRQYTRKGEKGTEIRKLKNKKASGGAVEKVCVMPTILKNELRPVYEKTRLDGRIETFICAIEGKLPNINTFNSKFKSFQKANNLPQCRFHDLRHSFAMLQLELETDIKTLSGMLGHSKIAITGDIYLKDDIMLKQKAVSKMNEVITLDPPKPKRNRRRKA